MPHFILEYSANLNDELLDLDNLFENCITVPVAVVYFRWEASAVEPFGVNSIVLLTVTRVWHLCISPLKLVMAVNQRCKRQRRRNFLRY